MDCGKARRAETCCEPGSRTLLPDSEVASQVSLHVAAVRWPAEIYCCAPLECILAIAECAAARGRSPEGETQSPSRRASRRERGNENPRGWQPTPSESPLVRGR